jgi:hypothetical protein
MAETAYSFFEFHSQFRVQHWIIEEPVVEDRNSGCLRDEALATRANTTPAA